MDRVNAGAAGWTTVRKTGSGAGTVVAGALRCEPACDVLILPAATVPGAVMAFPDAGSRFAVWESAPGQSIDILAVLPGDTVMAGFEQK